MSGVQPSDPVVLHRYNEGQTLCGGNWYTTGQSPCEVREAQHVDMLRDLPPCEGVTEADIEAAAALLGQPKASRCWTKDRASWDDPALQQTANFDRTVEGLVRAKMEEVLRAPLPHLTHA